MLFKHKHRGLNGVQFAVSCRRPTLSAGHGMATRKPLRRCFISIRERGRYATPCAAFGRRWSKVAASLIVKRRRWKADGTWPLILEAGASAILRMREKDLRSSISNEDTIRFLMGGWR